MRIYKPKYTKPIPVGVKILRRKDGRYARHDGKLSKLTKAGDKRAKLTKAGDRIQGETKHWHISFADNLSIHRDVKAYTDKAATERLAEGIQGLLNNIPPTEKFAGQLPGRIRDELAGFGLLDARQVAAVGKTLLGLVAEFEEWMVLKERDWRHIAQTISSVRRMLDGCGFVRFSDISADKLKAYLDEQRDAGKGISKRTYNGYVGTAKFFCRWLAKELHIVSPLTYLEGLENEETDRRRTRRVLRPGGLRRLLEVTVAGPERFGLTGTERSLLYRFAVETGLRANEIRTLTKSAFDFDEKTVTVKAGYSKHRREDVLPLREDIAAVLDNYLAGKLPAARAFDVVHGTAKMLRADLEDAGIAYRDADGKVFDFHSFRHQFITNLKTAPPKTQQALARHQSLEMTDKYTHFSLGEKRAALEDLPDLTQGPRTDGKSLLFSCFSDGQSRTCADGGGQKSGSKAQKTPLQANKGTGDKTLNLRTADPAPASLSTQVVENKAVTDDSEKSGQSENEKFASGLLLDDKIEQDLKQVIEGWPSFSPELKRTIKILVEHATD